MGQIEIAWNMRDISKMHNESNEKPTKLKVPPT